MKLLKKEIGRFPFGVWLALVALLLIFLAWIMQVYSLLDWGVLAIVYSILQIV